MAKQTFSGNLRSSPPWLKDFGGRERIVPFGAKIDAAQFSDQFGVNVVVGVAGAAQNATSVPVAALVASALANTTLIAVGNVLIPTGTVLYFGGAKVATTTVDAIIGDTSLTVAALPTALVSGDAATYSKYATEGISSGTLLGRTFAERDAGTSFGPAALTDDEIFLLMFDKENIRENNDIELCRHNAIVAENYLPNFTTLNTASDDVQKVITAGTATAGSFKLGIVTTSGALQWTGAIAWNATVATIITNAQAALDAALGASLVVITNNGGTAANNNFLLTFSGAGYTGLAQPTVAIDTSALTGATTSAITHVTNGGKAILNKIRQLYQCMTGAQ